MVERISLQSVKRILDKKDWNQLLQNIKPKYFSNKELKLSDARVLAQLRQLLINESIPNTVKSLCLKCLSNACLDSFKHKSEATEDSESDGDSLCDELARIHLWECLENCNYPYDSYFSYDKVVKWTVDYIITSDKSIDGLTDEQTQMLGLSIKFLCNFFTFAYQDTSSTDDSVSKYLTCDRLKETILNVTNSSCMSLAEVACAYVYNMREKSYSGYFMHEQMTLWQKLLKPAKEGILPAKYTLLCILQEPNAFEMIYSKMNVNEKVDLLGIIYNEFWKYWDRSCNIIITKDQTEFLAERFCERSDVILKTADTYVDGTESREVILILNILEITTSVVTHKISTNARSLLINCKHLLMSLHTMGKDSDNFFTQITNLSQVAPSQGRMFTASSTSDIDTHKTTVTKNVPEDHPAFGFKAGLIRVIANMVHKDKACQDLFREIDGIPLLLDCSNIDARNPLIPQWTIFAIRNLCEGNPENQEVIRNCRREGVSDNTILQEMGLTLREGKDGKSIRIAPLRRGR